MEKQNKAERLRLARRKYYLKNKEKLLNTPEA